MKIFSSRGLDAYVAAGLVLLAFGAPLAVYSYLVLLNVPLTAMGIACVVLGVTLALVPSSPVPAGMVRAMVEGSCVNIEALLEEFDARDRGVYLPPREGRGWVYVPLGSNPGAVNSWEALEAPVRVITNAGGKVGLMVCPPGSEAVRLSLLGEEVGLEDALNYVLVDLVEAVESVKAVRAGGRVVVEMKRPRVETEFSRFRMVLGSLPTSLAGSVVSHVAGEPMRLVEEAELGGEIRAVFEVVPRVG